MRRHVLRRAAHNDFGAEDDRLSIGAWQRARATGAVRRPCPPATSTATLSTPATSVDVLTPVPMTDQALLASA